MLEELAIGEIWRSRSVTMFSFSEAIAAEGDSQSLQEPVLTKEESPSWTQCYGCQLFLGRGSGRPSVSAVLVGLKEAEMSAEEGPHDAALTATPLTGLLPLFAASLWSRISSRTVVRPYSMATFAADSLALSCFRFRAVLLSDVLGPGWDAAAGPACREPAA